MRFARITLGLLLALAGLLATIAGAVAAFWLVGPDNTISTPRPAAHQCGPRGRHRTVPPGPARPDAARERVGRQAAVHRRRPGPRRARLPLGDRAHPADPFDPPATFGTQDLRGDTKKLTPPSQLDWWVAQSAPGSQAVNWPIQDGRYDVVVMNADGTPAVGAQVTFGVEVHRLFGICLLVLGAGVVVLALGLALVLRRRPVVKEIADTTEIPVITNTRIPVLVTTAPVQREEENAPAYRVSPFAPDRVSPFAPLAAKEEQPTEPAPAPAPVQAPVRQVPVRPAVVRPAAAVPAAPMFMSAARSRAPSRPCSSGRAPPSGTTSPRRRRTPNLSRSPPRAVAEETVPLAASPEFVKSDEAVRRTAALLASGAMLLTATSCGLMPPKNTMTAADSRPAVTLADAQAVVQRYNELNNQANKTRDGKLAATIEGNPTLAQTQAGFVIGRKLDAAGKDVSKPFTYTDPEIGAPQFTSYPMRFVVSSGVSDAPGSRQLGVWQRENAGSPWLLTHSVYPPNPVELPSIDGLRTPNADDLSKLQGRPEAVAKDLAAFLTGGMSAPQSKLFTPTPGLTKMLDLRAKSKAADTAEPYIADVTDTFALSGVPLTFITESGDALVFLSLTERYLQRVEPGSNAYWTSGEATAFSGNAKYTQTLHQDYLHQVAVVIPAKSTGNAAQVLSIDPQLVAAGGA